MGKHRSGDKSRFASLFVWIVENAVAAFIDYWPYLTPIFIAFSWWKSIEAIETKAYDRCRQWLKFWVMIIVTTLLESTFPQPFEWFPMWDYVKPVVICCLAPLRIKHFNIGARKHVYNKFIRPVFVTLQQRMNPSRINELTNPSATWPRDNEEHDD